MRRQLRHVRRAFVVDVPPGAIPLDLGAQPTVERLAAPADILDHDDVALSDGFVIDLHALGGFDTTADLTVTLPFDAARVPEATRTATNVFARVLDHEAQGAAGVSGRLEGARLILTLRGLPARATFAVVHDPTMALLASSGAGAQPLLPATRLAPWATGSWSVWYDPTIPSCSTRCRAFFTWPPNRRRSRSRL